MSASIPGNDIICRIEYFKLGFKHIVIYSGAVEKQYPFVIGTFSIPVMDIAVIIVKDKMFHMALTVFSFELSSYFDTLADGNPDRGYLFRCGKDLIKFRLGNIFCIYICLKFYRFKR